MKRIRSYKLKFRRAALSLIFLSMILSPGFASKRLPVSGNLLMESVKVPDADTTSNKTRSFFFGLTYGNNSSYLGRYQTQILPYYSADVSYMSKTGFWLSLYAFDIRNTDTFVDEVDVMTGWNFDLSKRVDASVFYTRFFFTESTELIKASVQNTASASLGLDWGYVYSKITGHYIFGGSGDFFLVFDNSRYIEFPALFHKSDYLSLEPRLSVIAGTQTFVDTYYMSQGAPLIRPGAGTPGRNPNSGGPPPPSTMESVQTTFDILSYELSLPVAYNTGKFSFEVAGRYSIPVNLLEGDTSVPQFFLTGGVVYFISSK